MVSLLPTEQESLDISNIIGVAQTLVETLHNLNSRLLVVEDEMKKLKEKEHRGKEDG
jgi:hypothetical protein